MRLITVTDNYTDGSKQTVHLVLDRVMLVREFCFVHEPTWVVECTNYHLNVSEEDGRRVLAAMADDLAALGDSALSREWEEAEARLVKVGAEMRRRRLV